MTNVFPYPHAHLLNLLHIIIQSWYDKIGYFKPEEVSEIKEWFKDPEKWAEKFK